MHHPTESAHQLHETNTTALSFSGRSERYSDLPAVTQLGGGRGQPGLADAKARMFFTTAAYAFHVVESGRFTEYFLLPCLTTTSQQTNESQRQLSENRQGPSLGCSAARPCLQNPPPGSGAAGSATCAGGQVSCPAQSGIPAFASRFLVLFKSTTPQEQTRLPSYELCGRDKWPPPALGLCAGHSGKEGQSPLRKHRTPKPTINPNLLDERAFPFKEEPPVPGKRKPARPPRPQAASSCSCTTSPPSKGSLFPRTFCRQKDRPPSSLSQGCLWSQRVKQRVLHVKNTHTPLLRRLN